MKFLIALLALTTATVASAQNRIVSIDAFDLSYTGGLILKRDKASGPDRKETTFRLNLNYAQALAQYPGLMWKGKAYFNREDVDYGVDSLTSALGAMGGLLFNFSPENIKESFYVGGLVGLERQTLELNGDNDKSGFNFLIDLEAGKRFDLGQYSVASVAYSPSLGLGWKRYGGDLRSDYFKTGSELRINFLKFDILF